MTTRSVTEDVKEKLLKVASELQIELGRRVDLNDALRFLVEQREKKARLLNEACSPTSGVNEALQELETNGSLTMQDLKGKLAIDTSALIELIYCDSLGQKLKKALETDID